MSWTKTCVLSAVLAVPMTANASVEYLLSVEGITGESQESGHLGAMDVLGFSWSISNPVTNPAGSGGGTGKVHIGDLHVTKPVDVATPKLFADAAGGTLIPKAELDFVKKGEKPFTYFKMTLSNVHISAIELAGDSGKAPTENVSFNYGKLELKSIPQKPDGTAGEAISGVWDSRGFRGASLLLQQLASPETPVNAVPLPAALPLFAGALFALGRRRRG